MKLAGKWRRRLLVSGVGGLVGLALAWCLLPKPAIYPSEMGWSRVVTDRHGVVLHLSTAPDGRYRLRTPLARVSPQWIEATLAKEDRWFRWHPGVNPFALFRAAWGSVIGHPAGGASTLTM